MSAARTPPAVPLVSHHEVWNHRWFALLPRYRVYESAETMSVEAAAGQPIGARSRVCR